MHHGHSRTNLCQQQRVLDRRIAAADHANILAGEQIFIASRGFYYSFSGKLALAGNVETTRTDAGRDDDCDRLQTFAAAQRGSFRTQIDRVDLYAGPQVEPGVFDVYRKVFEQFAAVASLQAEIVVDGVVDAMKLTAD